MSIASIIKNGDKKTLLCRTNGVCAHTIQIMLSNNDTIDDVVFIGGCQGNARAVDRLIKGMSVQQVIDKLDGVQCSNKGTSCTDQLAQALKEYLHK